MNKHNKTVTKFTKLYGRNIEDMMFCPEDFMRKFSDKELLELKQGMKDKRNALNNPGMDQLFLKLKKLFVVQVLEGLDEVEQWAFEKQKHKQQLELSRQARMLKQKLEKEVIKKLSPAQRKLLDL